jgi:hypothetical protein
MKEESLFDVTVHAKLDRVGQQLIFEMQIKDDSGTDITDIFRLFARMEAADMISKDCIDVLIKKRK